MKTSRIKLQDTPQMVAWLAAGIRQRFKVTEESGDVPMRGSLSHLVRRWLTVVVIDDTGEITPTPEEE